MPILSNRLPSSEVQQSVAKETESKKCKETETILAGWEYFERVKDKDSNSKAKCIYCSKKLGIDTCKHGTSSIRNHILSCKKIPHDMSTRQTLLAFQTIGSTDKEGVVGMIGAWKFDQDAIRSCVAKMIIIDELLI